MYGVGEGSLCVGVDVKLIRESECRDTDCVTRGFYQFVGNVFRGKGHIISNNQTLNCAAKTVVSLRKIMGGQVSTATDGDAIRLVTTIICSTKVTAARAFSR